MSEDGKKAADSDADAKEAEAKSAEENKSEAKADEAKSEAKADDAAKAGESQAEDNQTDESQAEEVQEPELSVVEKRQAHEKSVATEVAAAFGLEEFAWFRHQAEFTVEADKLVELATQLKTDERFQFVTLTDVSAVDYLKLEGDHPERFAVIYCLFSFLLNTRIRLRVWVDEDSPSVPTLSGVYGSANWGEREVFDMFGIEFDGHPNLIRILMPTNFGSHPLRKDYPLRGRGERDDFPRMRRGGKHDL